MLLVLPVPLVQLMLPVLLMLLMLLMQPVLFFNGAKALQRERCLTRDLPARGAIGRD